MTTNRLIQWGLMLSLAHFSLTFVGVLFDIGYSTHVLVQSESSLQLQSLAHLLVQTLSLPLGLVWTPSLAADSSNPLIWMSFVFNSTLCGFGLISLTAASLFPRKRRMPAADR